MGTRSCIMVKVRPSDKGKKLKFDKNALPVALADWKFVDSTTGEVYNDETGKERSKPVEIKECYIGIYCHWDGYVRGGVGDSLKAKFNNYDAALNLVVGGFCSHVSETDVRHYANRGDKSHPLINENWKDIKPVQGSTQKDVVNNIDCEYAYLFDEERGGWLYKHYPHNNKSGFKKF